MNQAWQQRTYIPYRIRGTGISTYSTYIWLSFMVNVGRYTNPMDPMGDLASKSRILRITPVVGC